MSTLKTYEEQNSTIEKEDQTQAFEEKNENSASSITLMPSEKIIQLLNILTKTNAKLNAIMLGQMSDIERSNEIENVVDTVSGLEEGTRYFSPLSCLTTRFEGL